MLALMLWGCRPEAERVCYRDGDEIFPDEELNGQRVGGWLESYFGEFEGTLSWAAGGETKLTLTVPYEPDTPYQLANVWRCEARNIGNLASFATERALERSEPEKPLRSHSHLHIAVARGDTVAVQRHLQQGIPIDLLAADGLAPLHWALAAKEDNMPRLLLDSGSPVDVRSDEGSTPLMLAVQGRRSDQTRLLLDRGADANAADNRGFTSLHRAAEMGQLEIAQVLLSHGASPHTLAAEHTPLSLAQARDEQAMVALLSGSIP
jgi:ankyrin repeat protein